MKLHWDAFGCQHRFLLTTAEKAFHQIYIFVITEDLETSYLSLCSSQPCLVWLNWILYRFPCGALHCFECCRRPLQWINLSDPGLLERGVLGPLANDLWGRSSHHCEPHLLQWLQVCYLPIISCFSCRREYYRLLENVHKSTEFFDNFNERMRQKGFYNWCFEVCLRFIFVNDNRTRRKIYPTCIWCTPRKQSIWCEHDLRYCLY